MTNTLAVVLGILIVLGIVIDVAIFGSGHMVYLGKKFYEFIEWLAFWR